MGFLAPISFWFLSAIPILLVFYFFKKQYDKQTISSIYLWERTIQEWESDRWWNRLQKNLLLLLQLLILLFLIVALTRPFLIGEEVGGNHLVIILDSSATMMAEENGNTRFSLAKQQAFDLIDQLGTDTKISFIQDQRAPALLVSNETDHSYVRQRIEKSSVSYQHENLGDSIQLAQSLIQQETGEVHVFTDNLDKQYITAAGSNPIVVHNIKTSAKNIALLAFGVKQSGNQAQAIVTVKNESTEASEVTLSISNDGVELEALTESIPAKKQKTMKFSDLPLHDYYEAKVVNDVYRLDNVMYALLAKQQTPTIYLVGEVNPFIEKALLSAGMEVITVPQDGNGDYSFPEQKKEAIYLLSGVDAKQWPIGPKLIISPSIGGPFQVKEKVNLQYALRQVADAPVLTYSDVNNVYLGQAYQVNNWNNLHPIARSGEQVTIAKGMYDGAPMILFAFDLDDSDWPLKPGFPILLANSIADLAGSEESLGYYQPLETANFKLSTSTEEAVMETLDGDNLKQINLGQSELTVPSQPGIYQLHEKSRYGSSFRYFVVRLADEERTAISSESFSIDKEGQQESGTQNTKQEFWRVFAALALFILFIEWEVYRRGISIR